MHQQHRQLQGPQQQQQRNKSSSSSSLLAPTPLPPPPPVSSIWTSHQRPGIILLSPFHTFSTYTPGCHEKMMYPGLAACLEWLIDTSLVDRLARATHLARLEEYASSAFIYREVIEWLDAADASDECMVQKAPLPSAQTIEFESKERHEWIRMYTREQRADLRSVMNDNLDTLASLESEQVYMQAPPTHQLGYKTHDGKKFMFTGGGLIDESIPTLREIGKKYSPADLITIERDQYEKACAMADAVDLWKLFRDKYQEIEQAQQNQPMRHRGLTPQFMCEKWKRVEIETIRGILQSWCTKGYAKTNDGMYFQPLSEPGVRSIPPPSQVQSQVQAQQHHARLAHQCNAISQLEASHQAYQQQATRLTPQLQHQLPPYLHLAYPQALQQPQLLQPPASLIPWQPIAATTNAVANTASLSIVPIAASISASIGQPLPQQQRSGNFIPCAPPTRRPVSRAHKIAATTKATTASLAVTHPSTTSESIARLPHFQSASQGTTSITSTITIPSRPADPTRNSSHRSKHPTRYETKSRGVHDSKQQRTSTPIDLCQDEDTLEEEKEEEDEDEGNEKEKEKIVQLVSMKVKASMDEQAALDASDIGLSPVTSPSTDKTRLEPPPAPKVHERKSDEIPHSSAATDTVIPTASIILRADSLPSVANEPFLSNAGLSLPDFDSIADSPSCPTLPLEPSRIHVANPSETNQIAGSQDVKETEDVESPLIIKRRVRSRHLPIIKGSASTAITAGTPVCKQRIRRTAISESSSDEEAGEEKQEGKEVEAEEALEEQEEGDEEAEEEKEKKDERQKMKVRSSTESHVIQNQQQTTASESPRERPRASLQRRTARLSIVKQPAQYNAPHVSSTLAPSNRSGSPELMVRVTVKIKENEFAPPVPSLAAATLTRSRNASKSSSHSNVSETSKQKKRKQPSEDTSLPSIQPATAILPIPPAAPIVTDIASLVKVQFKSREEAEKAKQHFDEARKQVATAATVPTVASKKITAPVPASAAIRAAPPRKTTAQSKPTVNTKVAALQPATTESKSSLSQVTNIPVPLPLHPPPSVPSTPSDLHLEQKTVLDAHTGRQNVVWVLVLTKRSWQRGDSKRLASRDEMIEQTQMSAQESMSHTRKRAKKSHGTPVIASIRPIVQEESKNESPTATTTSTDTHPRKKTKLSHTTLTSATTKVATKNLRAPLARSPPAPKQLEESPTF